MSLLRICLVGALMALLPTCLFAQESAALAQLDPEVPDSPAERPREVRKAVYALRLSKPVTIDGRLDEPAWAGAQVISGFTQREPEEGAAPSERTVVRVLYDDDALYVSARLHDSAPDSIVARLARRDTYLDSDAFYFFVDPYHDRRSGFYFGVNAAGTLYDGVLMNDDWDDDSWDGVWEGEARIDEGGWTVEMRIPYTQLRFREAEAYVWGVNFRRDISRHNERDYLVIQPRNESGFVSRFWDLHGIASIEPRRQLEVVPYVTARAEYTDQPEGNPFNDGSRYVPDVGGDLKVGLTNNLTLNATVNPDFGQVEVDPAVVNLSDFEVFFPERRPFFIEGANTFRFGQGGATSNWSFNWSNPTHFYSRRIGRAPQGSTPDAAFEDYPENTRILGATKLTGKLGDGVRFGAIQSVTGREEAELFENGERFSAEVEPLAYYGVTRLQKEWGEGRRALGVISTVAARRFDEDRLRDEVNGQAYVTGLDGWTFLDRDRTWVVTGWASTSHVTGTADRILALQTSSQHYFQRPDVDHVRVDSSATSLTGFAGRVALNKQKGNFFVNSALGTVSPAFNPNDLGFLSRTDVINGHLAVGYRWTEPRLYFRRMNLNLATWQSRDYSGNLTGAGLWTGIWTQYRSFWESWMNLAYIPRRLDARGTRGGPLMESPPGVEFGFELDTDTRKDFVFEFGGFGYTSSASSNIGLYHETVWKPAANVQLVINPRLTLNRDDAQYVDTVTDPLATQTFGRRYVFAELDQTTLSSSVRLNWTFSPTLSLQVFAQPLISAGTFTNYKELARPETFDFLVYGEDGSTLDPETLEADPDGSGPAPGLTLDNQDFNFKSLRGTAVLRWEFRPGSRLFLVWTQDRSQSEEIGDVALRRSVTRLFDATPDNIFMVKFTYWLSR